MGIIITFDFLVKRYISMFWKTRVLCLSYNIKYIFSYIVFLSSWASFTTAVLSIVWKGSLGHSWILGHVVFLLYFPSTSWHSFIAHVYVLGPRVVLKFCICFKLTSDFSTVLDLRIIFCFMGWGDLGQWE